VEKIGVFVNAPLDEIYQTVRQCRLTGIQLHYEAAPELPARLHVHLGQELKILRVVHFDAAAAKQIAGQISLHNGNPHIHAVLVDSLTAAAVGGTGMAFDWALAGKTIFKNAQERKLIAAGGLTPENISEAIAALRPWGIDAVSGVEAVPGRKDPFKIVEFVLRARAAAKATSVK
jgi:phosphoribosylanthranilate isomerase